MAWRDQYQQGSFRGATFRTEYHERSGGRRVAVHEFPGRDDPEVEDLGRRARRFSIDCHVIGTAYTSARDALIEALETSGPGLLVHPFHGRMLASVLDYRSTEDTEEGGLCRFSIEFVEAGQPTSAPVAIANGNSSADQAEFVLAVAPAQFAAKFTVKNAAAFVEDAATGLVDGMAGAAQTAAALRGGAGPTLRAFEAGLRFLPDNISGLMRSPIDLGLALVGLVQAVSVLGSGVGRSQKLASLQLMLDWESEAPVFPVRTPQRTREAENRIALLQLFHVAGAAELVRAAGSARYASYEEARDTCDAIATRLDAMALVAADAGDDAGADLFDRLRWALTRDIAARGATIARIYTVRLPTTETALTIAHRHYGGAGGAQQSLTDRAADLVARNGVVHPGFVPGGAELELLTVENAA